MNSIRIFGLLCFLSMAGCAADSSFDHSIKPGHKPELTSTEAGLWMRMERAEKKFAASSMIVRDSQLQQYLENMVCDLAPDYCSDIRIYVVDIPLFNASMAPNGAMNVWTGLLLRAENEAQLAAVLGHEIGHYINRHQLKQWNSTKTATDFLAFFTIATGGIAYGAVGLVAALGTMGHINAYSRELESEADQVGQLMIHQAGYRPEAATELWRRVKEESEAKDAKTSGIFTMTHPPVPERIDNLQKWGSELVAQRNPSALARADGLKDIVATRWQGWLERLIQTRSFKAALYVIERLEHRKFDIALMEYYRGEVHRRRADEGDLVKAREHYLQSSRHPNAPAALFKQIGLIEKRSGHKIGAIEYFDLYLSKQPDAPDRDLILSYIKELRSE